MLLFIACFFILIGIVINFFPKGTLLIYRELHKSVGTEISKNHISIGYWRACGVIFTIFGLMVILFDKTS